MKIRSKIFLALISIFLTLAFSCASKDSSQEEIVPEVVIPEVVQPEENPATSDSGTLLPSIQKKKTYNTFNYEYKFSFWLCT